MLVIFQLRLNLQWTKTLWTLFNHFFSAHKSLQAAMEPYHLRMYSIQWNNILTWSWNHGTDQTSVQASGLTRFSSGLAKWSTHISRFLQLVHPTEELGEPLWVVHHGGMATQTHFQIGTTTALADNLVRPNSWIGRPVVWPFFQKILEINNNKQRVKL